MNAASVDFGQVGDTPPIFAQAAGAKIVYVAGQPITNGQGILVKPDSAIRTLAALKGKRIGFTKGSSAHNVVVIALEKAGLQYDDITPVYLSPPDGAAAFARDAIDAWVVWDPVFCDRRSARRRPGPGQRQRDRQDQFILHRQPRFCGANAATRVRRHRRSGAHRSLDRNAPRSGRPRARRDHRRRSRHPDHRRAALILRHRQGEPRTSSPHNRRSPIAFSASD